MNIVWDLCHQVQNAVKKFCKPFEKCLVNLWHDIHNDIKFSADIKAALQELWLLLDLPYKKPSEAVPHRWISAYTGFPRLLKSPQISSMSIFLLKTPQIT